MAGISAKSFKLPGNIPDTGAGSWGNLAGGLVTPAPASAPSESYTSGPLHNDYGDFKDINDFVAQMGQGGWGASGKQGARVVDGKIQTFDDPGNSGQGNLHGTTQGSFTPAAPASLQGLQTAGSGGGTGSGGSAKVVDPASDNTSPAMQGLQAAGETGAPGANMLTGPSIFRQGIGQRLIPNQESALAGLRRVY